MVDALVRLMVLAALVELGLPKGILQDCREGRCLRQFERATRTVAQVDWKPISMFPKIERRFR
jgi:hypothetical protein